MLVASVPDNNLDPLQMFVTRFYDQSQRETAIPFLNLLFGDAAAGLVEQMRDLPANEIQVLLETLDNRMRERQLENSVGNEPESDLSSTVPLLE